jgi:hypothetical protein
VPSSLLLHAANRKHATSAYLKRKCIDLECGSSAAAFSSRSQESLLGEVGQVVLRLLFGFREPVQI